MTLKKENGKWNPAKITLVCTVIATLATVVIALPTGIDYARKTISPWTTMPDQIATLSSNQFRLEKKLDSLTRILTGKEYAATATNNFHLASKLINQNENP